VNALLAELLATALPIVLSGIAAALAPAAKRFLDAHQHSATLDVLVGALGRAAQLGAQNVATGQATTPDAAAAMVQYVQTNLPGTVAKLAPSPDALAQMATAILIQTLTARGVRPVAG
jgi:hypothetical protein